MMEQYTGDFLAAIEGLQTLLGARGHVWPITTERASICAQYADGTMGRGEVEVDAGQVSGRTVERLWLDPPALIHPQVAETIKSLDAIIIGPGSFFTSLLPIFLVDGCREAIAEVRGPVIHVANLLTEGRGMASFTAADAVAQLSHAIGRPVDSVVFNVVPPSEAVLWQYAREDKHPLQLGKLPAGCEVVEGGFWRGAIARHDRSRLRAAVWALLAAKLVS
jgi:uncharacterized cofD-like protein